MDAINIISCMGASGSCDDDDAKKPVLVHDCWATYFKYDNVDHALCGSHPLRYLKHIEKAYRHKWAENMRRLLLDACWEVTDADAKKLSEARFEEMRVRYRAILTEGRRELPERPPRKGQKGRIPKSEAEKLLDASKIYKPEILCFACHSEGPLSNSRAERDFRKAKVKLKVSGTFPNLNHAQDYCRISSYMRLMSCQGNSSFAAVQFALKGDAVQMLDHSKLNILNQHHQKFPTSFRGWGQWLLRQDKSWNWGNTMK